MYQVGEYLLYGGHGVCVIDDVAEKLFSGKEKLYYVLHPISYPDLKLYYPVDGDQSKLKKMLAPEEAKNLMNIFKQPAKEWIEKNTDLNQFFNSVISSENRKELAELLNTLLRRKLQFENEGKKLPIQETKLLEEASNLLYNELAITLSTTKDAISKQINEMVAASQ